MPTRRDFLRVSTAAVGSAVLLRDARSLAQPPATQVRERPDVSTLDPNGPELTALRAGVAALRQRSQNNQSDPLGWTGQAKIHLDHCPHGNWFFLPWHRAYLYFFEQICRQAANDSNFILPYWNWARNPQVPTPFWDTTSPLYDADRDIGPSDAADAEFVGPAVIQSIMDNADFISAIGSDPAPIPRPAPSQPPRAQSILEGQPHNYTHGFVGGDMSTFWSPLDPIFWLHHANIDRIWTEWDAQHPGAFPTDQAYRNFKFTEFFETSGAASSIRVADLLDTEALGYRYPANPVLSPPPAGHPLEAFASEVAANLTAAAAPSAAFTADSVAATSVEPTSAMQARLERVATLTTDTSAPLVRVVTGDLQGTISPEYVVRVFLNCDYLTPKTPPIDPHYVGSFAFFGHDHADHGQNAGETHRSFYLNATHTVTRLGKHKLFSAQDALRIGLTTVPLPGRRAHQNAVAPSLEAKRIQVSVLGTGA